MDKAIDVLRHKIAVRIASADNKNYDIGLTIAEGLAVIDEFDQLQASASLKDKEIAGLKEAIRFISDWLEGGTSKGRPMDLMTKKEWQRWQALKDK